DARDVRDDDGVLVGAGQVGERHLRRSHLPRRAQAEAQLGDDVPVGGGDLDRQASGGGDPAGEHAGDPRVVDARGTVGGEDDDDLLRDDSQVVGGAGEHGDHRDGRGGRQLGHEGPLGGAAGQVVDGDDDAVRVDGGRDRGGTVAGAGVPSALQT